MSDVDDWFAEKKPPAEPALQRVRRVILGADHRMTEYVKYDQPHFAFGGDMASFVQTGKPTVSLMFHRGGRIEGTYPHMEGTGRQARYMRFADVGEVDARAGELADAVRAWCAFAERG